MRTPRSLVLLVAAAVTVAGAVSVASTEAARPKKGAVYKGRTSRGLPLRLAVSPRTTRVISRIETNPRTRCGVLGAQQMFAAQFDVGVSRGGRFSMTDLSADLNLDLSLEGGFVVVGGRQRRIFDVTSEQLSGRFTRSGRVRVSWRWRTAILDRAAFPEQVEVLDKCDTGVLTWTARRR